MFTAQSKKRVMDLRFILWSLATIIQSTQRLQKFNKSTFLRMLHPLLMTKSQNTSNSMCYKMI